MQPGDCAEVVNQKVMTVPFSSNSGRHVVQSGKLNAQCAVRGLCVKEAREAFYVQVRVQPDGTSRQFNLHRLLTGPSKPSKSIHACDCLV